MKLLKWILFLALLTSACAPKPKLQGVKAAKTTVESTVSSTSSGTVEAEQQAVLGFTALGRVASIPVHLGDSVKKGQILASLENKDLEIVYHDAENELNRAQELFKAHLLSRSGFDEAKKNFEISRSNFEKSRIKAPFDGIITELNLEIGELAQNTAATAKPPLRIVDLKPRIIKGDVDEVDLAKIKQGVPARIKIPAARTKPFDAEVTQVIPFVSTLKEKDRTSEIQLKITEITEQEAPIPVGASADIEVIIEKKSDTLALPARTILGRSPQRYVFVVEKGKLKKSPVHTGIGNYDKMEIISGVKEGDIVVFPPEELELREKMKVKVEIQAWP